MTSAEILTHTEPTNGGGNGAAARAVDWENPRVAAILSAAAKCFARKGFSATTLAEIGKELGLRKSIVHYYFASKNALIHEVQSFTQKRYLDKVKESLGSSEDGSKQRMVSALTSLWGSIQDNRTMVGLNIEVWAAARRDPELKKRAATLQHDARKLIGEGVADVLKIDPKDFAPMEPLSVLILAVLNGLVVAQELEGEENAKADEAFQTFLYLLRLGMKAMETQAQKS
ncbi:MAG: TetR/AcrR family transcriptional regulator [Myxococcales bacterium]|nr:TetR/AcrR family transcriptional regulator [Myxococcales bacterium]